MRGCNFSIVVGVRQTSSRTDEQTDRQSEKPHLCWPLIGPRDTRGATRRAPSGVCADARNGGRLFAAARLTRRPEVSSVSDRSAPSSPVRLVTFLDRPAKCDSKFGEGLTKLSKLFPCLQLSACPPPLLLRAKCEPQSESERKNDDDICNSINVSSQLAPISVP